MTHSIRILLAGAALALPGTLSAQEKAPQQPTIVKEQRIVIKQPGAAAKDHVPVEAACAEGKSTQIESSEAAADGKKRKVVMRFCSKGADMAKAGDGLKAARERISKDANLSPALRDDILKQLDAEIDRLAKQG